MKNYITVNKQAWNLKTDIHLKSDFYNNEAFLRGESTLKDIELGLLGNIQGKSVLHLQCHFGQDSMSLARLGAKVTAVDFSEAAIAKAKELNSQLGLDVNFICSNVYDLPKVLHQQFDYVFTSYGVIGWLQDLDAWAAVIGNALKKGGKFVMVEFHPVVWMFDDEVQDIVYSYFKQEPIQETEQGTYADKTAPIAYQTITWNHSLSEVLTSLLTHGISIQSFQEYDYSHYNCFNNTVEENGVFRIQHLGNKIPLMFSVVGQK